MVNSFQSTLPLRGATRGRAARIRRNVISIHTPLAGSDWWGRLGRLRISISIHTPLAGSDPPQFSHSTASQLFQSTLPLRGATEPEDILAMSEIFQSTLPLRGATDASRPSLDARNFNPHSPCGERLNRVNE